MNPFLSSRDEREKVLKKLGREGKRASLGVRKGDVTPDSDQTGGEKEADLRLRGREWGRKVLTLPNVGKKKKEKGKETDLRRGEGKGRGSQRAGSFFYGALLSRKSSSRRKRKKKIAKGRLQEKKRPLRSSIHRSGKKAQSLPGTKGERKKGKPVPRKKRKVASSS